MEPRRPEEIMGTYDLERPRLEAFRATCQQLVQSLLAAEGISVHSVTSRIKTRDSLAEKVGRPSKQYAALSDLTDIVGVRIITYFDDEVDRIGDLIRREMELDTARSVDKRQVIDYDRFGYLSVHYICRLSQDRLRLSEHKHCVGLTCEIQVRTILQHAWAEIEHDLGYKAGGQVAVPLRRRFSRLAGLLELADGEFARLRDDIRAYSEEVRAKIVAQPMEVRIDEVSLAQFLDRDAMCRGLDEDMAALVGAKLTQASDLPRLAEKLQFVGIETIDGLSRALTQHESAIRVEWKGRLSGAQHKALQRGISIFHLWQLLALEQGGVARLTEAFARFKVGTVNESSDRAATRVAAEIDATRQAPRDPAQP